jgi:hypothetical protein
MGIWTGDPALGLAGAAGFVSEIVPTRELVMKTSRGMGLPVDGCTASRILFDRRAVRSVFYRQNAFGLIVYG